MNTQAAATLYSGAAVGARSLSDTFSELGVDVVHHFSSGLYAKETTIPAGVQLTQHTHKTAHLSVLAKGTVVVDVGGDLQTHVAPACLNIAAGRTHSVRALTDAVWYCIHATDETDPDLADAGLVL